MTNECMQAIMMIDDEDEMMINLGPIAQSEPATTQAKTPT